MKQAIILQKTKNGIRHYVCLSFIVLVTSCVSATLSAQNVSYTIEDDPNQWFIGFGVGPRIFFADHARQLDMIDRISGGADLYVGKWWGSILGSRLGGSWQKLKGATKYNMNDKIGNVVNPGHAIDGKHYLGRPHFLYRQQFNAWHLYTDLLFNVSNLFEGTNNNRFWTLVPFIGVGYIGTWDLPNAHEFSFNAGLLNKLRVGDKVDLTFDIRGAAFKERMKNPVRDPQPEHLSKYPDRLNNDTGYHALDGIFSVNIGVEFRFGGNGNPKPTYYYPTYIEPVRPVEYPVEVITEWNDVATDVLILFRINESTLLRDARVQLNFLARLMHQYPEGTYTITGYADEGTGNPDLNQRLSRARAERVKECLVGEFGISPFRLQTVAAGGIENRYYNDPSLSRSVIIRPNKY